MQCTYARMIRRQDAPPHAQCAIVKLQSIIVPPEPVIRGGQFRHGISCSEQVKVSRENWEKHITIAFNLFQDDSQTGHAALSQASAYAALPHLRASRHHRTISQDCACSILTNRVGTLKQLERNSRPTQLRIICRQGTLQILISIFVETQSILHPPKLPVGARKIRHGRAWSVRNDATLQVQRCRWLPICGSFWRRCVCRMCSVFSCSNRAS